MSQQRPAMSFEEKQQSLMKLLNAINTSASLVTRWLAIDGVRVTDGSQSGKTAFDTNELKQNLETMLTLTSGVAALTAAINSLTGPITEDASPVNDFRRDLKEKIGSTLEGVVDNVKNMATDLHGRIQAATAKTSETPAPAEKQVLDMNHFRQLAGMVFGDPGNRVLASVYGKYAEEYALANYEERRGWPNGFYSRGSEFVYRDAKLSFAIIDNGGNEYSFFFAFGNDEPLQAITHYIGQQGSVSEKIVNAAYTLIQDYLNLNAVPRV